MTETKTDEIVVSEAPAVSSLPAVRQERRPRTSLPASPRPPHFPAKIAKAILAITQEIGAIQKEGQNEFQKYRYVRWEDINEKLSPLLAEHGLIIVQSEQTRNLLEENDKGSVLAIVYHFTIVSAEGEQWPPVEWTSIARLRDQKGITDDKAAAKCHTQAEKQFCIKQFKIRSDDGYDADDHHKSLPKKDAGDGYKKFQTEIDSRQSLFELAAWAKFNAEAIRLLPKDWQNILHHRFSLRKRELLQADIDTISSLVELDTWFGDHGKAMQTLAQDDQAAIREYLADKRADLENQTRSNPEYVDEETGEVT